MAAIPGCLDPTDAMLNAKSADKSAGRLSGLAADQDSGVDLMTDMATPNLPSRNFEATSRFYAALGFTESWRDAQWMILNRGDLRLEFFPYPDLDPLTSAFGCCLRVDDLDGLYAQCLAAGLPEKTVGQPRLNPPTLWPWGGRMGALIDADGSLLRLIQN